MKTLLMLTLFLGAVAAACASSASSATVTTQSVTIPGSRYTLNFGVQWTCDDYPQNSAPGRIELVDGGGNLVGRVVASVYSPGGISVSVTGAGSVSNTSYWMGVWATDGAPADGELSGTWNISGVAPGDYTLRFYSYTTWETTLPATSVWTTTNSNGGSVPPPPTIAWTSTPGTVASGQSYTVSAHGHDDSGSLTRVSIWKNGQPFAVTGAGNGTDSDATGPGSDAGPQTITFTAQATDSDGTASGMITQTVTVAAPEYTLTTAAASGGSVTPGGSYPAGTAVTVSATPDATHWFAGWTGDAGGSATTIVVTLDRSKSVQALFSGKAAQTITFDPPGNRSTGSAPFALSATASSGLPVTFTVLSGPATFSGGVLQVTGPGAVTVQASQPGDASFLPAAPVAQTFNVTAPVVLKYQGATRTLLATPHLANGTPLVIQAP